MFARIDGIEGQDQYVFFYADSTHPNYHLVQNVVPSQNYVSEFRLEDYPVTQDDILHTGDEAFSAALNTVNVGKFNLSFGSIGLTTHGFYESIRHAHNRIPRRDALNVRQKSAFATSRVVVGPASLAE